MVENRLNKKLYWILMEDILSILTSVIIKVNK